MRAVIARRGQLICEDIAELTPKSGEVLVKTLCCGICGSDLHALHHLDDMVEQSRRAGSPSGMDPQGDIVFGHEFCAEVLDYAPGDAKRLKAGTRVVSMPVIFGPTGYAAIGYSNTYPGGYAERMLVSDALLLEGRRGLEHDPPQFAIGPFLARRREPHEHLVWRLTCAPVEQRPQHARLRVGNARIGEAAAHRSSRRACGVVVRSRRCDRRMSLEAIRSDDS